MDTPWWHDKRKLRELPKIRYITFMQIYANKESI